MKISIIIPNLNDSKGLEETLKSISIQDYKNFECIVIDGLSSDKSVEIIKQYEFVTKWVSEKDKGIYDAINKGIKISQGDIINTINSGDKYFSNNSLNIIIDYFKKYEKVDFIFGAVKKDKILFKYEPNKMYRTFNFYPAHSGGFFVKKKVHDQVGLYSLEFPCSADYDFFWRIINSYNFKGMSTKENELISIFKSGGFSSQYGVYNHIWEETKIRLKNKQNFVIVYLIYFLRLIKNFNKFF